MTRTLLSVLFVAAPLLAGIDAREWQYRRTVKVATPGRLHAVVVDRAIYAGTPPGLADLRLTLNGNEVPYVLSSSREALNETEMPPVVLNRVIVPKQGLQLTLDAGRAPRHNRLRIATPLQNFRIRVLIETSDDGRAWAIARSDGALFDFTHADRHAAMLTVDYPLSTRRYVRATFFGWTHADAVPHAWLTLQTETNTQWQTLATLVPARFENDHTTYLMFDLGTAPLPFARVRIDSATARFYRACEVESSADGKLWTYSSTQPIYRLDGEESLTLSYSGEPTRYVRLKIRNRQDQPLAVRQAMFDVVERRLQFLPAAAGDYVLYYGSAKAEAPAYDLGMILAKREPEQPIVVLAGAQELNRAADPASDRPWTERHPEVLYGTLALAVAGMGWYCVRFLRQVKRAAKPE